MVQRQCMRKLANTNRSRVSIHLDKWYEACGGNFPKHNNRPQSLCQILRMVTIETVIKSTHVYVHMLVTTSYQTALSRFGRCF